MAGGKKNAKHCGLPKRRREELKAAWLRHAVKWKTLLNLHEFTFRYNFLYEAKKQDGGSACTVYSNPLYFEADFDVHMRVLKGLDDEEIEGVVVHEFVHVALSMVCEWKKSVVKALPKAERERYKESYRVADEYSTSKIVGAILLMAPDDEPAKEPDEKPQ